MLAKQFREAFELVDHSEFKASEMETVLGQLPKMAVIVLVSAFKVAEGHREHKVFNFDAVYSKYQNYMRGHES